MAKAKYKPEENMKSIDQLTIAKEIAQELSLMHHWFQRLL